MPRVTGVGIHPIAVLSRERQDTPIHAGNATINRPTHSIAMKPATSPSAHHLRFHESHQQLSSHFGNDWLALRAEAFARWFGTPIFIVAQTLFVFVWVSLNVAGVFSFDIYPFILLNLAFSLQAAYAAPLILLAQTRQTDRDKAHTEADALHREDLAHANEERLAQTAIQVAAIATLLEQNTRLTEMTQKLTERIDGLTSEMHKQLIKATA